MKKNTKKTVTIALPQTGSNEEATHMLLVRDILLAATGAASMIEEGADEVAVNCAMMVAANTLLVQARRTFVDLPVKMRTRLELAAEAEGKAFYNQFLSDTAGSAGTLLS